MLPVSPHNTLHTAELVSFANAILRADHAIAAKTGGLIIWYQALPHSASVNQAATPRMLQYVNSYPLQ